GRADPGGDERAVVGRSGVSAARAFRPRPVRSAARPTGAGSDPEDPGGRTAGWGLAEAGADGREDLGLLRGGPVEPDRDRGGSCHRAVDRERRGVPAGGRAPEAGARGDPADDAGVADDGTELCEIRE